VAATDTFNLFVRDVLAATRSFTSIPVGDGVAPAAGEPAHAATARHFPAVGIVVGMAACMVFAIVSLPLPQGPLSPLVAAVMATAMSVLLTGALHERAAERFAGVLGLVLLLAGKLALLALLGLHSPAGVMAALLAGYAVSRFWPLLLAASLPHVGQDSGEPEEALARPLDRRGLAIAAAWCVVPLMLMVLAGGVAFLVLALAASGAAFAWLRARYRARQRGFTLDGLGFAQQACECAFYLGAAFGVGR
jgi:adenosylcobinamide-GDP ribazoletransferase